MPSSVLMKVLLLLTFSALTLSVSLPFGSAIRHHVDTTDVTGPMTFKGTIGGHYIEHIGTAEQIFAHAQTLHPEIQLNLNVSSVPADDSLQPREAMNKDQILCCPVAGQDWLYCSIDRISDGISHLRNLHGRCHVGPRGCARISCSWGAGIFLCNDNKYSIEPDCGYLATYAEDLQKQCPYQDRKNKWVCGQQFDTDNYNVVVRYDDC